MNTNPRLQAAVTEAQSLKSEPLSELDIYRIYIAQFMKDRKAGRLDEYEPEEIQELAELIEGVLRSSLDDGIEKLLTEEKQENLKEDKSDKRRTSSDARKVGAISKLPTTLAVLTLKPYQYSMSLHQDGGAYLQPFRSTDRLTFKDGKLFFKGEIQEISEVELQNLKTKEGIECIDLPLLRMFYSIVLEQFERTNFTEVKDVITLYVPELAEVLGLQRNLNKNNLNNILMKVQSFHNVVGVLHGTRRGKPVQSYYPVLNFEGYDDKKNTIAFSSPYMNYLIKTVYDLSIKKDKNGKARLKKSGEPLRLATHSYLINSEISTEKNKAAVENVFILVQLIEQAGDNIPRIKASTLIERNPQLQERLENSANKRQLLKRTFAKTWELLRSKTRLMDFYKDIVLPDPKDPTYLPNESELENLVISFPHNGKKR